MAVQGLYIVLCECGGTISSPVTTGLCPHCGLGFVIEWQANYKHANSKVSPDLTITGKLEMGLNDSGRSPESVKTNKG